MDNLRTTLICMAYGFALWALLGGAVALAWVGIVKYGERRQRNKFARAWNEWMGLNQ